MAKFSGLKDTISELESKEQSNEIFMCVYVANVSACPKLMWMNNTAIRLKFKGSSKISTFYSEQYSKFIYHL